MSEQQTGTAVTDGGTTPGTQGGTYEPIDPFQDGNGRGLSARYEATKAINIFQLHDEIEAATKQDGLMVASSQEHLDQPGSADNPVTIWVVQRDTDQKKVRDTIAKHNAQAFPQGGNAAPVEPQSPDSPSVGVVMPSTDDQTVQAALEKLQTEGDHALTTKEITAILRTLIQG